MSEAGAEGATAGLSDPARSAGAGSGPFSRLVTLLVIWHALVALLAGIGFVAAVTPASESLPWPIRSILIAGSAAAVVAGLVAATGIRAGRDGARSVALALNYLLFVAFAAALAVMLDLFIGIDALAGQFESGIWFALVPLAGYLWIWVARRVVGAEWLERLGRLLFAAGLVVFAVGIGLLDGLAHMAGELLAPWPLISVAVLAITGFTISRLWTGSARAHFGTTQARQDQLEGFLFLSPNLLGFLFFFAGPLLFSLVISFWDWDALGDRSFVGLANYIDLFSLDVAFMDSAAEPASNALQSGYAELWRFDAFGANVLISAVDTRFWQALGNIAIFLVLGVPLSVIPALLLSNLLNMKLPGMKVFRAIFFIPSIAGVVGITLIWEYLFDATVGWLNYLLTQALPGDVEIRWLSDQDVALLSIVIVFAWMTFGFNTVLFLAGLQGVPPVLHEAAKLDGANAWQRFRHVTLPTLRPTTFFVTAMTTIQAIQLFEIVFVLMTPPEGPNNSTLTPVLYLYQLGFQQFSQGYAAAVAWVLFALIFAITLVQFRRNRAAGQGVAVA